MCNQLLDCRCQRKSDLQWHLRLSKLYKLSFKKKSSLKSQKNLLEQINKMITSQEMSLKLSNQSPGLTRAFLITGFNNKITNACQQKHGQVITALKEVFSNLIRVKFAPIIYRTKMFIHIDLLVLQEDNPGRLIKSVNQLLILIKSIKPIIRESCTETIQPNSFHSICISLLKWLQGTFKKAQTVQIKGNKF